MKHPYNMTIRMGASHWDATIHGPEPVVFDFRKMTREQRRTWYGTFMASVRRMLRKGRAAR